MYKLRFLKIITVAFNRRLWNCGWVGVAEQENWLLILRVQAWFGLNQLVQIEKLPVPAIDQTVRLVISDRNWWK